MLSHITGNSPVFVCFNANILIYTSDVETVAKNPQLVYMS